MGNRRKSFAEFFICMLLSDQLKLESQTLTICQKLSYPYRPNLNKRGKHLLSGNISHETSEKPILRMHRNEKFLCCLTLFVMPLSLLRRVVRRLRLLSAQISEVSCRNSCFSFVVLFMIQLSSQFWDFYRTC